MSLSRPTKFPLLKLPWLCIECVIKSSDIFDIICFALLSRRTRQIVKHSRIPLNGIQIFVSNRKWIRVGSLDKCWNFGKTSLESLFDQNSRQTPLVLQNSAIPLYTSRTDDALKSYTDGNEMSALKMAMEFLNEVFKCSVKKVSIQDNNFPESGDIGVKSSVELNICYVDHSRTFGRAQYQKLNLLLENLKVTGTCTFRMSSTYKDFYCDPKLLKCKKLVFWSFSNLRITRETLLQFEVAQLNFSHCSFSMEDIVSFVTQWFHTDKTKLEYLCILFPRDRLFSLEKFQTEELNPVPFNGRNRVLSSGSFRNIDFSQGLEIVRHDGLRATIHVDWGSFLFYIWHNQ